MGKLHKFKKWLTVSETANYLSIVLGESVNESDVFHLVLEDELDISVNFVNGVRARKMKVVPAESATTSQFIALTGELSKPYFVGTPLDGGGYLEVDSGANPVEIDGVWDLNLFSNDRFDLERKLYRLIGGPDVTRFTPLEGIYVFDEDHDLIYELLEPEPEKDIGEMWRYLVKARNAKEQSEDAPEVKLTVNRRLTELPADSILVVRMESIHDFERRIAEESSITNDEKAMLSDGERASLQKQVAALALVLAERGGKYSRGGLPNGNQIAEAAEELIDDLPNAKKRGISKSAIRASIAAGIKLLKD